MESIAKKKNVRKKLAKEASIILTKRSTKAYKKAKKIISSEKIKCKIIHDAMCHFMLEWQDVQHPGLLSVACEAVGGNPNSTNDIGVALLFLLGSAHIHDDVIDQSKYKGSKLTIYGKFGRDIALLVGDAFLFEGLTLLYQFTEKFSANKRRRILDLIKTAFFEIGSGEATEVILREKYDFLPKSCMDYLRMRAAVAEAIMRIGAIIGDGDEEEIELLGHYGRTLGLLSAMRDEFIDMFEPQELENRYRHECLPLPILQALQNTQKREEIVHLLQKKKISEKDAYALVDLVMNMKEVQKIKKEMELLVRQELQRLKPIEQNRQILALFICATIEDL
jgi:geranylgeranyl pyrophosphate synthase